MELKKIMAVCLGGLIGTFLRYLMNAYIKQDAFPFATGAINIIGCLLIGLFMGYAIRTEASIGWRLFLVTGLCGGFTTFSAFAWENIQLMQQGRWAALLMYTLGSIILGFLAVFIGFQITK